MRALRVVVWGLGPHALKNIVPALQQTAGTELYGVCSRNRDVVSSVAGASACHSWTDPGDMLADPRVDAVYVATPIGLHAAQGRAVLRAGKHLWCEKPLAENAEQVMSLLALSRGRGITIGEGFMYLHHPHFITLQEIVQSGRLGHIHAISCRFGIPPLDRLGFRLDPTLGGGAFLDVASYPISAAAALFPDFEPEILLAEITVEPGSAVDSAGRAVLRYKRGVCVMLEWGINRAYRSEIDVWGTEGSVLSDRMFSKPADYIPRFRFLDRHGQERYESGQAQNHFVAMLQAFHGFVDDPAGAERERFHIERRARLVDSIREHSKT